MKNKINGYSFERPKKEEHSVVVYLSKKIPPMGYSAKQLSKMFKKYHKNNWL